MFLCLSLSLSLYVCLYLSPANTVFSLPTSSYCLPLPLSRLSPLSHTYTHTHIQCLFSSYFFLSDSMSASAFASLTLSLSLSSLSLYHTHRHTRPLSNSSMFSLCPASFLGTLLPCFNLSQHYSLLSPSFSSSFSNRDPEKKKRILAEFSFILIFNSIRFVSTFRHFHKLHCSAIYFRPLLSH